MSSDRFTGWAAAAIAAMTAVGCGAAPGDATEDTAATGSALTPIHWRPLPPWDTSSSGSQSTWVDASGNTLSNITLSFNHASGVATHSGTLSVAIWDDRDLGGPTDDCSYALLIKTATAPLGAWSYHSDTKGPLLCNGTPYFASAPAKALPQLPWIDMLTAAFEETAGDTLANICAATNQHGTTLLTPMYVNVWTTGTNLAFGIMSVDALTQNQAVSIEVTLQCS